MSNKQAGGSSMPDAVILNADCLDVLREMADASVDAVVTDPPYGLSEHSPDDVLECLRAWCAGEEYRPSKRGFMGRSWDAWVPGPEVWREVLRVLKPGGHVLVFAGSRTQDLMGMALRLAGFEMRDTLQWIYGCLSDDSEALTRRGWVRGPELRDTDDVLQWDAATGVFSWARPSRIVIAPYTGAMVRLANRNTDQLLTPNHRVYARVRRHGRHAPATDYEVLDADAVGSRSSAWRVTLPVAAQLREGESVDADYAYLVGWWLTNAWVHGDGRACMFSQSKPETLARLREALAPHGASEHVKPPRKPAHAKEHTFYLAGPMAERLLSEHPARRLTWAVLGWSWGARHALYRGLMDGDGSQPSRQHAHTFWSKDAERRDVFLALATSLGYRAFIGAKDCVYVNTGTDTTEVQGKHRVAPVDYDGLVWCVTVPTRAFLARRNGRPFITGNSGFPKSLDVSKAIDKAAGAEREVVGYDASRARPNRLYRAGAIGNVGGNGVVSDRTDNGATMTAPATDAARQWSGWGTALKPAYEPIILARKPLRGTVASNVLAHGTGALNVDGCRVAVDGGSPAAARRESARRSGNAPMSGVTGAESDAAGRIGRRGSADVYSASRPSEALGRWPANVLLDEVAADVLDGQSGVSTSSGGTALKPAYEPIILARKPLRGTVASNVLAHGTGALNVDGCRVAHQSEADRASATPQGRVTGKSGALAGGTQHDGKRSDFDRPDTSGGRWPSNVILDEAAAEVLDGQSGVSTSSGGAASCGGMGKRVFGRYDLNRTGQNAGGLGDSGGASRFFYVAKASRAEREAGLDAAEGERANVHPTVKPVALMRWLVRLITPPGGLVLDPFAGSGSTGVAAVGEGFRFVGVEREAQYADLARRRICHILPVRQDEPTDQRSLPVGEGDVWRKLNDLGIADVIE